MNNLMMSHRNRVTLLSALASSLTLGLVLLLTGWMLWRTTQDSIDRRLEGSFRGLERRVFGDGPPPGPPVAPQTSSSNPSSNQTSSGSARRPGKTHSSDAFGRGQEAGRGPFGFRDHGQDHDARDWRRDLIDHMPPNDFRRRHDAPVSSSIYELNGNEIVDLNNGSLQLPKNLKDAHFAPNVSWKIFTTDNKMAKVLVATDVSDRQVVMGRTFLALLILWPALTALLTFATYAAVSSSFRPLHRMLAQAAHLSLNDRLEAEDKAEFGELAASINAYLDRIETVVRQQEEFAVDAAHELCTPLTALRGQLEVALLKKADAKEFAEAAKRAVNQVARLERLVESLLLAARPKDGEAENIDVQAVVEEAGARWVDRYAEKQVDLEVETVPYISPIRTEELECVIDNLLANALRYSGPNTGVRITLKADGGLVVQDEGPGISIENRERVFERFERGTSVGRGFGIGLYLARRLLTNRNGTIAIGDSVKGTRVEIQLPKARS